MGENGVFDAIIAAGDDVFKYYADGEWKVSNSGKSVPIVNPTTRNIQFFVQVVRRDAFTRGIGLNLLGKGLETETGPLYISVKKTRPRR
ncbi:hypothetical protein Tco_1468338 [Tanacetum coccineum]